MLGRSFYPLTLDFGELENESGRVRVESSSFQKMVTSQLMNTTQVGAIRPYAFDIVYTRGKAKKVPVVVQSKVTTEKQYYISEMHVSPDSILVYAPEEILDTLTAVYTKSFACTQVDDTIRRHEILAPVFGAKVCSGRSGCGNLYRYVYGKKLEIPIHPVNFPQTRCSRPSRPRCR